MNTKIFKGIIPALYTAYNNDGSVNYSETGRLAKWLKDNSVGGFYLCGTTGDGLLLSKNERKSIVEAVSDATEGNRPLLVHVGCMNTADSLELAQHAAAVKGVAGISSLPPQYYPMPLDDEITHLSTIAAATDLPFYPYLFSSTVEKYGVYNLIEAFARIPNMAGIKAFIADLSTHKVILNDGPKEWELMHGFDECLANALMIPGVDSAIGSTYNIVPETAVAIYEAIKDGDFRKGIETQQKFNQYWLTIKRNGGAFLAIGRYLLNKRGFNMGSPRQPILFPSNEILQKVENELNNYDLL